jgi:hypothetical protein
LITCPIARGGAAEFARKIEPSHGALMAALSIAKKDLITALALESLEDTEISLEHVPKELIGFFDQGMLHSLNLSASFSIR